MVRSKRKSALLASALSLLLVLLATPKMAHAYVDPGSGAMLWQIAAAAAIGSLFYVKRAVAWLTAVISPRTGSAVAGFVFASVFAIVASLVTIELFNGHPVPRFNDIFLIGIVLTAYLFTWRPAVYLWAISVMVSAWVLPPFGSLRVEGFSEWYRLLSFAVVSLILVFLVSRGKARKPAEEKLPDAPFAIHGAAFGAD